ncbi:MAG: 50S ribosomal protein L15 [Tenericutes bacterium]|nr:50S ribosomal protein L15 [Mycoplasmatota bacterium]
MKLNELKTNPGSTHRRKIVGRGPGSGLGKTSGRGEKGQKARSGASIKPWFEGGQNPLYKRIPRRGFNNARFTTRYAVINVSDLNRFEDGTVVTPELLKETGLIKKTLSGIKILGSGDLTKKLTIKANVFTTTAISKIESNGGKAEVI